jgi:hypothetical protein
VILARKTGALADCLPPIDRCMESTRTVAMAFLIYVTKPLATTALAFLSFE